MPDPSTTARIDDTGNGDEELAPVHYLPTTTEQHEGNTPVNQHEQPVDEDEVLDAELVSEEEYRRLTSQRELAIERYRGYGHDLVVAARAARTAGGWTRAHAGPPTGRVTRFAGRHAFYATAGTWDMVCDCYKHLSGRDIDEEIHAARAAGDHGTVAQLVAKKQDQAKVRLEYLKVLGKGVLYTPVVVAGGVAATLATTLVVSIAAFLRPGGMGFAEVWTGLADAVVSGWGWLTWAGGIVPWAVGLALAGIVATGYNRRRNHKDAPAWLTGDAESSGREVIPDEGAILQALRNLGLPAMNKRIKEGWVPRWVEPTTRDGRGWRTQLELPQEVTVEAINDKKSTLAHNLVRKPSEVWPIEPRNKPGVLDLWVADQGVLSGPVDPWPLLEEGTTDFFKGVPVGIDQRGDEVYASLMACNYIVGGTMGSGKSSLVINMLLGAMLDPLVDIDVHVMAYNSDYDALKPRLRSLVKGDEDEDVTKALEALRNLRGEVTRRGKKLESIGDETKLTRDIAAKDASMRPRIMVIDECQELFEHPEYGEEAKDLAAKVQKKARKCGIVLVWLTPSPSAASLPRDLAKTASHRVCFAIGDHQGSDAVLGTGKHKQGITATGLVPGEDVGTAMASGFRRDAGLLRCHYIRKDKETDQHSPVVARALQLREKAGITGDAAPESTQDDSRDLLADLDEVLGTDPVSTPDAVSLLRKHAPGWAPYERLTGKALAKWLADEYDHTVPAPGNRPQLRPDKIRALRAEQAPAESDAQDGE